MRGKVPLFISWLIMASKSFQPLDDEQFAAYLKKKSEEIKNFCCKDDSRQPFSTSASDMDSSTYCFDYPYRGLALILHNDKFISSNDRVGSLLDKQNLVLSLKSLGFDVVVFNNLTASQLKEAAEKAPENYKHQEADCFVCVVLSHGDVDSKQDGIHHVIAGSDSERVSTYDIIKKFDRSELEKKPKLFFIQACRGKAYDDGCQDAQNQTGSSGSSDTGTGRQDAIGEESGGLANPNIHAVPLYRDCLIMYATPPGYFAWRSPKKGSWFIQELCNFLQSEEVGNVSFLRGLTSVSNKVATYVFKGMKQMPIIETMLMKDIIMKTKIAKTSA